MSVLFASPTTNLGLSHSSCGGEREGVATDTKVNWLLSSSERKNNNPETMSLLGVFTFQTHSPSTHNRFGTYSIHSYETPKNAML
jgi:hypothetical protein